MKYLGLLILVAVLITAVAADAKPADPPIAAKCKADLAERLELKAQDVKLVEVTPVNWPDASLGMPEIDKAYAQVLTPGYRIILEGITCTRPARRRSDTAVSVLPGTAPCSTSSLDLTTRT